MYYVPQVHRCRQGHEFNYSPSWASEGAWPFPLTLENKPFCPQCFRLFLHEHVEVGEPEITFLAAGEE